MRRRQSPLTTGAAILLALGLSGCTEDTLNQGSVGGIAGHAQRLWDLKNTPVNM